MWGEGIYCLEGWKLMFNHGECCWHSAGILPLIRIAGVYARTDETDVVVFSKNPVQFTSCDLNFLRAGVHKFM